MANDLMTSGITLDGMLDVPVGTEMGDGPGGSNHTCVKLSTGDTSYLFLDTFEPEGYVPVVATSGHHYSWDADEHLSYVGGHAEGQEGVSGVDPALVPYAHWWDTENGHTSYSKKAAVPPGADVGGPIPVPLGEVHAPVRLRAGSADQARAALFTAALWGCVQRAGGPRPAHGDHGVFPGVFSPDWLAEFELPTRQIRPVGQGVALGGDGFSRFESEAALLAGYGDRPRTWVFERVQESVPWLNLAAGYLTTLSESKVGVGVAVYDSHAVDQPSAAHWDQWYSAVVQVEGAKVWRIGADGCRVTTRPGDVLLMPEGLVHAVSTPVDPGYSRHLVFNIGVHSVYARV